MRLFLIIAFVFGLAASAFQASAQTPAQDPVEIGDAGKAYLNAVRLRGISTDVSYYDPDGPAPALDTQQQPETEKQDETSPERVTMSRWTVGLIAGLFLAGIVYVILRFGGDIAISLDRDAANPDRQRRHMKGAPPAWAEKLGSFQDIMKIEDRRRALVLLTQKLLATLATGHGVLMQRSWTARDTIGHIPLQPAQQSLLRSLVLTSERVQFGDRDVSEDEFSAHVSSCQQLLSAGTA